MRVTLLHYIFILFACISNANAQYIPVSPAPNGIYSFLEENHLNWNSSVKPLGRQRVFELLTEIDTTLLNHRQLKELTFYLEDYNKEKYPHKNFTRRLDALYMRDSIFSLSINPIGGGRFWKSGESSAYHWWNGLYAAATVKRWSFFASLTDNHESERLMSPQHITQTQGGANIKEFPSGKQDYWDSRGGVSYAWDKGHIGLIKDNFTWGSGYNGTNIFSGRTPTFVHFSLNLRPVKWFEFNYVHGWLVSEVVDSSQSFSFIHPTTGSVYRKVFHSKFLAANLFTFKPFKGINISAGNSIIYDYSDPHPAYLVPVMFYKAVDHHLQSGIDNMNSMMFMDISLKMIPYTHLFFTAFVDEMAVKRFFDSNEFNFLSYKGGFRINNLISNTYLGAEFTWTNALTFRHYVPTLTFESNRYNLGHYLGDNARELFIEAGARPFRGVDVNISYTHANKGPDHTLLGTKRVGIIPFSPVVWTSDEIQLTASWQLIHDVWLTAGYTHRETSGDPIYVERYSPPFWRGKNGAFQIGLRVGR
jgi:hypothetical protein